MKRRSTDKKHRSMISKKIHFAMIMFFMAVVAGAMAVISFSLDHFLKQTVSNELKSIGYLAVESIKDDEKNDFSYNFINGAFRCGEKIINNDFTLIRNLKKSTECMVEFFWDDVRVYTVSESVAGKSEMFTKLGNDVVYGSVMKGESRFYKDLVIESKPYSVLYMPLRQTSSNEIVGIISVSKPMESCFKSMTLIKICAAVVLLVIVFCCSAAVSLCMSKNIHSITSINEQMDVFIKNFESDEIDMRMRINVSQMDEIGILAHNLNVFIMQVQARIRKWKVKTIELSSYVASTRLTMDDILNDNKPKDDIPLIPSIYDDSLKIQKDLRVIDTMINSLAKDFDKFERL